MSYMTCFFYRKRARTFALVFTAVLAAAVSTGWFGLPLAAQSNSGVQQQPTQPPDEAGGPQNEVGPMAIPKKKEEPPPERPKPPRKPEGMPEYSLRVDATVVNVPVLVTTKEGQFIPGLKAENFRVFEDGVPQQISSFNQAKEAPITA